VGFWLVLVLLSPKFHCQELGAGLPVLASWKLTERFCTPLVGVAVNSAATAAAEVSTVMREAEVIVLVPPPFVSVNVTV
jgi:hypothetical protein